MLNFLLEFYIYFLSLFEKPLIELALYGEKQQERAREWNGLHMRNG